MNRDRTYIQQWPTIINKGCYYTHHQESRPELVLHWKGG